MPAHPQTLVCRGRGGGLKPPGCPSLFPESPALRAALQKQHPLWPLSTLLSKRTQQPLLGSSPLLHLQFILHTTAQSASRTLPGLGLCLRPRLPLSQESLGSTAQLAGPGGVSLPPLWPFLPLPPGLHVSPACGFLDVVGVSDLGEPCAPSSLDLELPPPPSPTPGRVRLILQALAETSPFPPRASPSQPRTHISFSPVWARDKSVPGEGIWGSRIPAWRTLPER